MISMIVARISRRFSFLVYLDSSASADARLMQLKSSNSLREKRLTSPQAELP